MKEEIRKARQRYNEISSLIAGDSESSGLLRELVDSAKRYVAHLKIIKEKIDGTKRRRGESEDSFSLRFDTGDFSSMMAGLEKTRQVYHRTLTSNLTIFNRYLLKNHPSAPSEGICPLSNEIKEQRYASAEWAKSLVDSLENQKQTQNNDN